MRSLPCPIVRFSAVALLIFFGGLQSASAGYFVMPYNANVFLRPIAGDAGAVTEFGYFHSAGALIPLFTGLPATPAPAGEVGMGFFLEGSSLDFYMVTSFFGQTHSAFSNETDLRSLNSFTDTNNSLGLGGSTVDPLSPITWLFRLDNAASLGFDDDDNDLLMHLRLEAVPETSSLVMSGLACLALVAGAWRKRWRVRSGA